MDRYHYTANVTPVVTVITTIAMDNSDYLGDTIEKVTAVKCGIIKNRIPCIAVEPDTIGVKEVIVSTCRDRHAECVFVSKMNNSDT